MGQWFTMRAWLDELLKLSRSTIQVQVDPALMRRVETATVRVDVSRIKAAAGWTPRYSLPAMLGGKLDYYRSLD